MKLFGTSGIRGPADTLFTNDFCLRLGSTFGTWLANKGTSGYVAVAMDPRESSPAIKHHLIKGLAAAGWEILDEGVIPTPALTYFCKSSPFVAGAVMVTGSHIAANLNGVKFFFAGQEVTKAHEPEIESLYSQMLNAKCQIFNPAVRHESAAKFLYLDLLKSLADLPYPRWKIVVDTANGTQTQIVKDLFLDLNLDFSCTGYCDIQSPHFVPRDTESPQGVAEISRQVLLAHADMGVAFDVDGDRVVFVDDVGRFIPGDDSCSLLASDSPSSCVVTSISASSTVDRVGKTVYRTPVGSTHVAAAMQNHGCTFGFEPNGGAIYSDIHFGRDGAVTMIKLFNYLKAHRLSLSQAYDQLPKYYVFKDKFDCPVASYPQIYNSVRAKYASAQIDSTDGLKVYFDAEEWLLFRGSGNAPEFRIFAHSPDERKASLLGQTALSWAKSLITTNHLTLRPPNHLALDSLNILSSVRSFPLQCRQVIKDINNLKIPQDCFLAQNIVVSGMGGSALGGRIIASLERQVLKVPVIVSASSHLPAFVNSRSLVVVSSYSGDTEETLSSLADAQAKKAQVFVVTSGGQLADLAIKYQLPSYIFTPRFNPSGQPRMGLGYNIVSLLALLTRCHHLLLPANFSTLPDFLIRRQPIAEKLEALAQNLEGKIIVLLSGEHLVGAAHALKNQLNENAKSFAASFDLPEANHHLLDGLGYPKNAPLALLFLSSPAYSSDLKARFNLTRQAVEKQGLPSFTLDVAGPNSTFQALDLVQSGAFLAYFLSQVNRIDPGPIPWVNWFKDEIRQVV